jgi:acyl-coenzyme A thioesterase PaaI-like protein
LRFEQQLGADEITSCLDEVFPGAMEHFTIEDVGWMRARVRMPFQEWRLRPGGTISGPSLMTLADTALWVALLAMIGREPLSVTSHLDIDFLRKPAPADVIAHTTLHTSSANGSQSVTSSCTPTARRCPAPARR